LPIPDRKFTLDGKEYTCKGWSVGDLRKFVKHTQEISTLEAEKQLDETIAFILEQVRGITKEEIESWDSIMFAQMVSEIIKANNTPPLGQRAR
jgi:hypothetical protein